MEILKIDFNLDLIQIGIHHWKDLESLEKAKEEGLKPFEGFLVEVSIQKSNKFEFLTGRFN